MTSNQSEPIAEEESIEVSLSKLLKGFDKDAYMTGGPFQLIAQTLADANADELTTLRAVNCAKEIAADVGVPRGIFDKMMKAALNEIKHQHRMKPATGFPGIEKFFGESRIDYGIYECSAEGVFTYDPLRMVSLSICSHPIFPTRRYTNIETGSELIDLSFYRDGRWLTKEMIPRQTIAQARQIAALSEFGIGVTSENAKDMVRFLSTVDDRNRQIIPRTETISRLGWVEGRGFSPYIDGVLYDNAGKFGEAYASVRSFGDYGKWMEIAKKVRASATRKVVQILMAASAASIALRWTCNQPFLVHLWSTQSGSGKTVATMLAASLWADPTSGRYVKSLNSTNVAFEQMAAFCNNLPLCLDELQTIQKNSDFDDIIYMLGEGTGRARSTRNLGMREQSRWLNVIITNGEQPITSESRGGAINRVVSLESQGMLFDGTELEPGAIADTLRQNYGFAGQALVKALSANESFPQKITAQYQQTVRSLMKTATGKQANYGAALLIGDWLLDHFIFKDGHRLKEEDIAEHLATPEMVDMNERARSWLSDFVMTNTSSFMREGDSEAAARQQGKLYGYIMADGTVGITTNTLREAMKNTNFDYQAFLRWCDDHEYIRTNHANGGDRHWAVPTSIPGVDHKPRLILFSPKIFESLENQSFGTVVEPEDLPF